MIDQKTDALLDESLWDARDVARYFRASCSWVYHQAGPDCSRTFAWAGCCASIRRPCVPLPRGSSGCLG